MTYATDILEHHRAGKLRILASSGPKRLETLPDVPTFAELGYSGMDRSSWMGLFAPKGTPRPIVDSLNRAIAAAASTAKLQDALKTLGLSAATSTPDQLRQAIRDELAIWAPVVKESGYSAD
ncbi:Tripartite tricarboxylate transporter family receptor [Pigmentiphaga humi]|uniref:Tripartite tricarboxylate transporter family receptor n=1 Tax=Pigmentiphaga humi TaxID=2478468 RepID=A0A3P4AYL1_9BURK|nr:Tripartite tricarboxylate transporter family receptor [Pigmentiphaga humi]